MGDTEEGDVGSGMFRRLLGSNFADVVTFVNALLIINPADVLFAEFVSWFVLLSACPFPAVSRISSWLKLALVLLMLIRFKS
jgi:hypothetical protein